MGTRGAKLPARTQTAAGDRHVHQSCPRRVRIEAQALHKSGRGRSNHPRPGWQEECKEKILELTEAGWEKGRWNILGMQNNVNRVKTLENKEVMVESEAEENPGQGRRATARCCAREQHRHTSHRRLWTGDWLWCKERTERFPAKRVA